MAFETVGKLKDGVSGLLTGLNLNNVNNLYGAFERAIKKLVGEIYIPEATGKQSITFYSGVYDYALPTNIFGTTLVDIRPQGEQRNTTDVMYKRGIEVFDRAKGTLSNGYLVAFEYVKGTGRMRVDNVIARERIVLDTLTDHTDWTLAGTITASYDDETDYWFSPASIRFNQTTGVGTITRTLESQSDLTDYEGVGVVFLAISMPTALTSVEIRIGSDASNYFSVTETTGHLGAFTTNEWLLIAFDLADATETGTVDITKVDYVQIRTTSGASINNLRVGGLWVSLPSPHDVIYSSGAVFLVGSTVSPTITDDNDEIILQPNAYVIYETKCALEVAFQQGGSLSSPLIKKLKTDLYGDPLNRNELGMISQYRAENPSEKVPLIGSWYG